MVAQIVSSEPQAQAGSERLDDGQLATVVCETGFNAGHSALLFLKAHPSVVRHRLHCGVPTSIYIYCHVRHSQKLERLERVGLLSFRVLRTCG